MADQDTPNPAEDPRDLARRLAEEAKAKQLARQLVEQAKAKSAAAARPPVVEQAKRSLAERTSKPVSVEEALRRAIEEEKAAPAPKPAAPARPAAPVKASAPAVSPAAAAPVAAPAKPAVAAPAPAPVVVHDAQAVLRERLPGVHVVRAVTVSNRVVFSALWQAHRARALADKDLALLVTSDALLDAATRVPEAALVAAHIEAHDGAWAVWVDASRPAMLGLARQPELLLAGL